MNLSKIRIPVTISLGLGLSWFNGTVGATTCPVVNDFILERSKIIGEAAPEWSLDWLTKLSEPSTLLSCGNGLDSAAWYANSLAAELNNWSRSEELSRLGVTRSDNNLDKALWKEQLAIAAFKLRSARPDGTLLACAAIDDFVTSARDLQAASVSETNDNVWIIPVLHALSNKDLCLRETMQLTAAAAVEQQSAIVFVNSGQTPDVALGGFLPEEALFRASLDLSKAGVQEAAAATIASISFLPKSFRPATQHAWNAVGSTDSIDHAVALSESLLRVLPRDQFTLLQVVHVATLASANGNNLNRDAVIRQIDTALKLDEAYFVKADHIVDEMHLPEAVRQKLGNIRTRLEAARQTLLLSPETN